MKTLLHIHTVDRDGADLLVVRATLESRPWWRKRSQFERRTYKGHSGDWRDMTVRVVPPAWVSAELDAAAHKHYFPFLHIRQPDTFEMDEETMMVASLARLLGADTETY